MKSRQPSTVRPRSLNGNATGQYVDSHSRSLAGAVIPQSIEDLWNPVHKRGSLKFFKGNGFAFCTESAGISYIKQLAIFRMLANVG